MLLFLKHTVTLSTITKDQPLNKDNHSSFQYCIRGELYSTGKQVAMSKWALLLAISLQNHSESVLILN